MTIQFHTEAIELSQKQKDYLAEKIGKLSHLGHRLDDESVQTRVSLERDTHHSSHFLKMHVHISIPGGSLDASTENEESIEAAIDSIEKKLRSQIEKLK